MTISKKNSYWGFDTKNIDKSVRSQDDFYHYANGGWIKRAKIPAEESRWGSFIALRYKTEQQLRSLLEKLPPGPDAKLVKLAHQSATDMARRNQLGITPLAALRREVYAIETLQDLLSTVASLHARGLPSIWGAFVDQDSKNSSRYVLHFWQGGLSLPDRDYYLVDKPEQKRVRDAYLAHIGRVLKLARFTSAQIAHTKEVVLRVETALAKASMKKEDTREPDKVYHKLSVATLKKLAPAVDWPNYFKKIGATRGDVIIGQPEFFASLSKMLRSVPIEDWKTYLEWQLINGALSALSEPFIKARFEFYGRALTGQKKIKQSWRRALGEVSGLVGESLGKLYVKKHFPESSKRAMDALVNDLFDVYTERIKRLVWMSPTTKKKALQKLRAMGRKVGYPTKWQGYRGLVLIKDDYFGNVLRSNVFEHKRMMRKLRKPIDRTEWFMHPQTVNAYFAPSLNEIVFPAAILQYPIFDLGSDMAINYGCIGAVIGHEITHGFDDGGSKFDGKGNMKNWWTAADKKRFERKSKRFIEQADKVEVEPGVHINGKLTLGENIADAGGLVIGYEAYQKYLAKHGRRTIGGFSPEQRFFLGFALFEQELVRPEFRKLMALTDSHADGTWRINGPLSNFEPFYKAFGIKKGDKMHRGPKNRAEIW